MTEKRVLRNPTTPRILRNGMRIAALAYRHDMVACSLIHHDLGGLMAASTGSINSRRDRSPRVATVVAKARRHLLKAPSLRTWMVIVSTLCLVTLATADAEVRRNAGRRVDGGMGLDLRWYCQQRWGEASSAINLDRTADGWRCTTENRPVAISTADACKVHYGHTAVPRVASTKTAEDLYCVLGLDLTSYCKSAHGANSQAVKRNPSNPDSWKCRNENGYAVISMRAACRHHYGAGARPVLGRHDDPQAWTCEPD